MSETWVWNTGLINGGNQTFNISFKSNDTNYSQLRFQMQYIYPSSYIFIIHYGSDLVYGNGSWYNENYKTITFDETVTDTALLSILNSYATKIVRQFSSIKLPGSDDTYAVMDAVARQAIEDLPSPMVFKGTLGTDGTITTLPTASASNEGFTYKVITAGTYASQEAEIGDVFISNGEEWTLVPSGDEPSGTVTNVATGDGLTGGPITSSGTISHSTASGYKHVPSGGSSGQILEWSADGTAAWSDSLDDKADKVSSPTAGNILTTDASGNMQDSGYSIEEATGIDLVTEMPASPTDTQILTAQGTSEALAGKQDSLPAVTNDRYLHTNSSTGNLEWSEVSTPTIASTWSLLKGDNNGNAVATKINFHDSGLNYLSVRPCYDEGFLLQFTNLNYNGFKILPERYFRGYTHFYANEQGILINGANGFQQTYRIEGTLDLSTNLGPMGYKLGSLPSGDGSEDILSYTGYITVCDDEIGVLYQYPLPNANVEIYYVKDSSTDTEPYITGNVYLQPSFSGTVVDFEVWIDFWTPPSE